MSTSQRSAPVQPGEKAPDFSLPAVHQDSVVSLSNYVGRAPLLLAIFRGLYCPFCRRAIAQFGGTSEKLRARGVESLAVVATELDNARIYFKLRPSKVPIAADPGCTTHRAFGLPQPVMDEQAVKAAENIRINPTGELAEPAPLMQAAAALDKVHGYHETETDVRDFERQGIQLKGQFLLDRDGIVRWANIECASEGLAGFGKFPTDEELLGAVGTLS
ncbi:MAG: peroxiredoxin-like family protein [Burkholderiales bacterium]|nr:peroxiredoxin-like family protein [Burkholderiales bacterium]